MEPKVIEVKTVKSGEYLYFGRIDCKDYDFKTNVLSQIWYYDEDKVSDPAHCAVIAQFKQEGAFIKKYSYWKEIRTCGVLWFLLPSTIILIFSVIDVIETYSTKKNE